MTPVSGAIPLYRRFPGLEAHAPRLPLCQLPTPVVPLPLDGVANAWVKRDDLTARPYGGNKVRKLEFLLAHARQTGAKDLITFGYAGSNHALATALCARPVGFRVTAILLPQPNACYVRRNLLAGRAAGAKLIARDTVRGIAATVAWQTAVALVTTGRRPYIIPAGGSSPIGVLGYVNAAFELSDQISEGALQPPDRIYFSLGSMGTAAGLAIGLALAGIDAELHAVRVVDTQFGSRERLEGLIRATLARLKEWVPDFPVMEPMRRVIVRDEFFGMRYGEFTESGVAAVRRAREAAALRLDGTYSGKAFGALLADAAAGVLRGKRVLFWNTHNSGDVDALGAGVNYRDLPRAFHRYFEQPVQALDPGA